MRTLPDGFTGAIMAIEGISDACAFLHGPGGCRVRHMVHSSAVYPRADAGGEEGFFIPYYNGYPRVPATYLDEYDFINGAFYKVEEALPFIDRKKPAMVVIVNSPGASLIGDNHEKAIRDAGMESMAIYMDEGLSSMPVTEGVGRTLDAVMRHLGPVRAGVRKDTVNLLGLSTMDKDWRSARDELVSFVESMGLEVIAVPGAGSSVDDLRQSVDAEYNIVVCPEMCVGLIDFYRGMGIPEIRSPAGAPVGFDATESWVRAIAEATGKDPSEPLFRISECRDYVYDKFAGMKYNALRIKGLSFSIAGTASAVRPLTEWLYRYLAMAPVAVKVDPGADLEESERTVRFLESVDYADAWDKEPLDGCDVVLCEGITALTMALNGSCRIGIPIGYSSMGLDDIIPRPVYGLKGVLFILDEILHGVRGS